MSDEANGTKTEVENGVPETSKAEGQECNGTEQNVDETVQEPVKGSSKFGAGLKTKAIHAREGIRDKVGDLKGKFAKLRQKSVSVSTSVIIF